MAKIGPLFPEYCPNTDSGEHIFYKNVLVGKFKNKKGKLENIYSGKFKVCVACKFIR